MKYFIICLVFLFSCNSNTEVKQTNAPNKSLRIEASQSWRQVGQIKATDEDGDALEFADMRTGATPFSVDKCGMIIVKDEEQLKVGKYRLKIRAKELYTKERYEVSATITIKVVKGKSPSDELPMALLNSEIVFYKIS